VRADFVTDYLFNPQHPAGLDPNPQYFSYNQWSVSQPLLKNFGVDVTMASIKIACAEAERTDWQFKQQMLAMIRSIETTYWALYAQQQNLKAIEQVLPHFREVVRLRQEQAGGRVGTESEVARAQSDLYLFEQRRLETLSKVAENALVLRNLMGLAPDDCREIALLAVPTTTRPFETLQEAVNTAVNRRPDVLRQRLAVFVAGQERILAENVLKPQLDLNGYWRTNGLGEELDESWDVKDSNDFNDWHMGFFFQVPLGRRLGRAELRAAELRISRERTMLDQTAHQASYEVADAYRRLNWAYQQLQITANRQQALNQWSQGARATFENPPPGMTTVFALELYLQNLRDLTDASISANAVLADYNSALARLEEVKGTLLENWQIQVAGDTSGDMSGKLPPANIQLPESVAPSPAPVQPAPAQPLPAQPAPQGAMIAPPMEIAQPMPQAMPAPAIEMPQSVMPAPEAIVESPVTPGPIPQAAPFPQASPSPAIEMPRSVMATPEAAPPVASQPRGGSAIEMPQSLLPEPPYTAMLPEPMGAPAVEMPSTEMPMAKAPLIQQSVAPEPSFEEPIIPQRVRERSIVERPRTEAPAAEEPFAEEPMATTPEIYAPAAPIQQPARMQPEIASEIPQQYPRVWTPAELVMPQSVLPTPGGGEMNAPGDYASSTPALNAPMEQPAPQALLQMPNSMAPMPQRTAEQAMPQAVASPMPLEQSPSASLQMPNSVQVGSMAPLDVPGAYAPGTLVEDPAPQHMAAGAMQFPDSIRSGAVALQQPPAAVGVQAGPRPDGRPLQSAPHLKPAPREQAGPKLLMPNSVRPAAAQAPMQPLAANFATRLQIPSSVTGRQ
jgi:outer membrane protein TolC